MSLDIPCAALTLTLENPLTNFAVNEKSLYSFNYEMSWGKDGYLATNTLLAMVAIAAKSYFPEQLTSGISNAEYLMLRRSSLQNTQLLNSPRENGVLVCMDQNHNYLL